MVKTKEKIAILKMDIIGLCDDENNMKVMVLLNKLLKVQRDALIKQIETNLWEIKNIQKKI